MHSAASLTYRYDGTFAGLLCCVFESYAAHEIPEAIWGPHMPEQSLFEEKEIFTNDRQAERVACSIPAKIGPEAEELVRLAFFTALPDKELTILHFLRQGYRYGPGILHFAGEDSVHRLKEAVKHLLSEAHLLKGFIRFSVQHNVLVTRIGPKNYVLPFLARHFSERYPEEHILIYDVTHHMALIYRPYEYGIIPMDSFRAAPPDDEERQFRSLWQTFYDAIEIQPRHNERCRRNFMPKRYWSYMTEFSRACSKDAMIHI